MIQLIGLLIVLILVFGALLSTGTGIFAALPLELLLICGAALGTLLLGNTPQVSKRALSGMVTVFRKPRWTKDDYTDLLALCYGLCRDARRGGLVSIETDIEDPFESERFVKYDRLMRDHSLIMTICDGFRMLGLDLSDPKRAEEVMQRAIATERDQRHRAANALHTLADALPALGIVAAVIGIIRAMSVIDQSPDIIGAMMAAALLGTFLGVFLAYGVVGPIANRYGEIVDDNLRLNEVAAVFVFAHGQNMPARAAAELARASIPTDLQPDSETLTHAFQATRFEQGNTSRVA